jgi:hypothetical protein
VRAISEVVLGEIPFEPTPPKEIVKPCERPPPVGTLSDKPVLFAPVISTVPPLFVKHVCVPAKQMLVTEPFDALSFTVNFNYCIDTADLLATNLYVTLAEFVAGDATDVEMY